MTYIAMLSGVIFKVLLFAWADARLVYNSGYVFRILPEDGAWTLICYNPDGEVSWETVIEGALNQPRAYFDGTMFWVSFSFRDTVIVDGWEVAHGNGHTGFWAAFAIEDGRLVALGNVSGNGDVATKGFAQSDGGFQLMGLHGGIYFELPLVGLGGPQTVEPMTTSVRLPHVQGIVEPQPQTDNPNNPQPPTQNDP